MKNPASGILLASASVTVLLSFLGQSPSALAQEARVEEIVVTGVRSQNRSVLSSPVPIDVLSAQALRQSGALSGEVGEALSTLVPSFNFLRQSNSGTSDHVRSGQLRGMSPDQLLVLVNGKRRHASAVVNTETKIGRGTAAVDFNTLTMGSIGRIEVLRDGAGAQYGSDAIAGVVNVIMDRDTRGFQITTTYGEHQTELDAIDKSLNDGETLVVDGKAGWSLGENGFLTAGFDLKNRQDTNRAGLDTIPFFIDPTPDNLALRGQRNFTAGDPEVEDLNLWYNTEISLGQNTLYSFATYGDRDTEGATFFRYPDESRNVKEIFPNGFRPTTLGENTDLGFTLGLRSEISVWTLDSSVTYGSNEFKYGAKNSLNASLGPQSPTRFDSGEYELDQLTVNIDFSRDTPLQSPLGELYIAAGLEFRREDFESHAGDLASWQPGPFDADIGAQGAVGLTPEDEADEDREVISVYVDVSSQVTDRLFLDVAARFEDYDDFGSELSVKLSFSYALSDAFFLRGAISNSLRAPSLSQIGFADRSTNFGENRSLVTTVTLPVSSPIAQTLGAEELDAETSENYSLGFSAQLASSLSLTVDLYHINVDDRITLSDRLFGTELADFVQAQPNGTGIESVRFFTNAIDTRTQGADIILSYETSLFAGNLNLTAGYNYSEVEIRDFQATPQQLLSIDPAFRLVGVEEINTIEESAPRQKANLLTTWQNDTWRLSNRITYYGSVVRVFNFGGGFEPRQRYGSEVSVDVETEYRFNDMASLTLGVNNVFDNYPDRSIPDINFFENLPNDILSPLGTNGRYWFAGVNLRF